jgi:uncharacterized OB-fold protein
MPAVEYRGMQLIVPENDTEFLGYYEAARHNKLVMKTCTACNLMRFPPGSGCPWCMSLEWSWQEVSGKGTIYSYEIIVHAIQPGFRELAPYPVVVVELDEQRGVPTEHEGLRVVANLVDDHFQPEAEANVAIGKRVEVVFQKVSDTFSLPQFKLSGEPPSGRVWQFPS